WIMGGGASTAAAGAGSTGACSRAGAGFCEGDGRLMTISVRARPPASPDRKDQAEKTRSSARPTCAAIETLSGRPSAPRNEKRRHTRHARTGANTAATPASGRRPKAGGSGFVIVIGAGAQERVVEAQPAGAAEHQGQRGGEEGELEEQGLPLVTAEGGVIR